MRALPLIIAASALLVAMTGCAPNIDAAVEKCAQAYTQTLEETQDGGLNAEAEELALDDMREMCRSFADDDPEGFVQEWG